MVWSYSSEHLRRRRNLNFHVDHFAAIAGTRSVRYASSSPRPASSLRSILANVPLSMSISAGSGVHMCTSGNLLQVRVAFDRVRVAFDRVRVAFDRVRARTR